MADTLTYDDGIDTVSAEDNLTPDEQDSLKVGEAMLEEQDQLLAGKYKNAEDLEKAYVELQRKLGENNTEDSETAGKSEDTDEGQKENEEEEEAKEDSPAVSLINEANKEYWDNDQKLSPETLEKFNTMSTQDLLSAYMEVQKGAPNPTANVPDLTQNDINVVKNSIGGEQSYNDVVTWAKDTLPASDSEAFNSLLETGNVGAIKLAAAGLKAQYDNANGYEGRMLSGKAPKSSGDVFRSQAQVVEAMSNPKYDKDPAYRQDIMEKLERSNVKF